MKVLKFGGTSVGSASNIAQVISIVAEKSQESPIIAVVSAVGGITDKLLHVGQLAIKKDDSYNAVLNDIQDIHIDIVKALIQEDNSEVIAAIENKITELKSLLEGLYLLNELSPKISDKLVSFGELLSSYIIAEAMISNGLNAVRKNSQELITTNDDFGQAKVFKDKTKAAILKYFKTSNAKITVLPGFVARSEHGEQTTLGRGGSDYTAAIVAAALQADAIEIWTDVSGMYTANPNLVKDARPIENISFQEAMELSHFGAKVLYPPTIQPVLEAKIPMYIKNTLKPEDYGTFISNDSQLSIDNPVKGITHVDDIALLTLQGPSMVGIPGFSKILFEALAINQINVIFITQASSEHAICIGINSSDAQLAEKCINEAFKYEIELKKIDPVVVEDGLSIIAVVGDNMKNYQGISGRMFSTLGKNNINVRAIAQGASERNISTVIDSNDVKKALNTLHERFFEVETKQINVFIVGVGNVGERLIDQIEQQHQFLKDKLKLDLRIVGMANSRKMTFNENGFDMEDWPSAFEFAEVNSSKAFFEKVISLNLRNNIFVDITADEEVAGWYGKYLSHNIDVVACNKIACSGTYENYKKLHDLALNYNASFLYETNVGAGLPIINTLNNLVASGDKVTSIQAVLSGSLNFVFNNFGDHTNFHDTVKRAQFEGYTEPDPRIDLSGIDVARKILILARENGGRMEIEDIHNETFLTSANIEAETVDDFYDTLKEDESHFQEIYAEAKANNCQLKYVAEYNNGKAKVGLREIPEGHPFYNLEGKDNIVMFYTERYPEQPLIVKGAGAGADVTASGLFADIIKIGNK